MTIGALSEAFQMQQATAAGLLQSLDQGSQQAAQPQGQNSSSALNAADSVEISPESRAAFEGGVSAVNGQKS